MPAIQMFDLKRDDPVLLLLESLTTLERYLLEQYSAIAQVVIQDAAKQLDQEIMGTEK